MERRTAIRTAALTMFGLALGKYDALAQTSGLTGTLSVNLQNWRWLRISYGARELHIPTRDVFEALEEAYGSVAVKGVK